MYSSLHYLDRQCTIHARHVLRLLTDISNAGVDIDMDVDFLCFKSISSQRDGDTMLPIMIVTAVRPFNMYTDTVNSGRPDDFESLLKQTVYVVFERGVHTITFAEEHHSLTRQNSNTNEHRYCFETRTVGSRCGLKNAKHDCK